MVDVVAVIGSDRRTDRYRYPIHGGRSIVRTVDQDAQLADSLPNPVSDVLDLGGAHTGQQNHEFFAAEPPDQIVGSGLGAELVGDSTQYLITHEMAHPVVERLEMIQVQHQHSERVCEPAGALEFPARGLTPETGGEQTSLAVGARGLLEVR